MPLENQLVPRGGGAGGVAADHSDSPPRPTNRLAWRGTGEAIISSFEQAGAKSLQVGRCTRLVRGAAAPLFAR